MGQAQYRRLYRRIGNGVIDKKKEIVFDVDVMAFEGHDGQRVGVISWIVKSCRYERVIEHGEVAIIDRAGGYFADTVERAVALVRELSEKYAEPLSQNSDETTE